MVTDVPSKYVFFSVAVTVLTVVNPCVKQESQSSYHNGILMILQLIICLCHHQIPLFPGVAQIALNATKLTVMATT